MFDELVAEFSSLIEETLPRDPKSLAYAAKSLSLSFTSHREGLGHEYLSDPEALDAYIASFFMPNAAKTIHCLLQMEGLGIVPGGNAINILDLGSGPGTSILAASFFFARRMPDRTVRFAGIERSRPALIKAHELFRRIAPPNHSLESATAEIGPGDLETILKGHRFDIVIAANLINELEGEDAPHGLCEEILEDHLAADGSLLLIDPALKETARPLMELRDRLISEGTASVAAPCLHQIACPMLKAGGRDWCHFYIDWDCPKYLEVLDGIAGMDHKHLKMSYFIFKKGRPHESRVKGHESRKWRVVSSPLVSKGKRELMLCGENGDLIRATRLDRDASEKNRALEEAGRGDIISCCSSERIASNDAVSIKTSWKL